MEVKFWCAMLVWIKMLKISAVFMHNNDAGSRVHWAGAWDRWRFRKFCVSSVDLREAACWRRGIVEKTEIPVEGRQWQARTFYWRTCWRRMLGRSSTASPITLRGRRNGWAFSRSKVAPLLSITSIVKMCKPWALPYPHPQSDGVHLSHFPRLPEPAACSLPRGNVPPLCAITYDGTIYRKKTA